MLRTLAIASGTRPFMIVWFALDAILALFPPVYWAMSGAHPSIFGLPLSLFYFTFLGLFITISLVVAYFLDEDVPQPGIAYLGEDR